MSKAKKILIVEDEKNLLKALVEKFYHDGFTTLEAENGVEGLAIALKEHPDLIILDLIMPKMDGIKMFDKLREDIWGNMVPVIVLTNLDLEEMKLSKRSKIPEQIEKNRPIYCLIKSNIKLDDVINKAEEVLGQ